MIRSKRKNWRWLIFLVLLIIGLSQYRRTRDAVTQWVEAALEAHEPVWEKAEMDRILSKFEVIAIQNLPQSYLDAVKMEAPPYKKMLASCKFYKLKKETSTAKLPAISASKT